MRKVLFGTTAIIAAAAFTAPAISAERIQLQLRGYHVGAIALTDVDGASDANEIDFGSDSEVHFRGGTTLDNGLEVSFKAELELEDNGDVDDDPDNIDEVYVQFDGGFGRVQFGQNDGVMDQMHIAAPRLFQRHYANDPSMDPFRPYGLRNRINSFGEFSGDDIKLNYFTPQMNGLQLGVSYTPNPCKNDTGYAGCVFEEFARNYWEAAATWEVDLNNVELGLSVGYGQGESDSPSMPHDPNELTFGGEIGFGNFTLGGSYAIKETGGDVSTQQDHLDVGGTYATGPWTFGLSYANAEGDMNFSGVEDKEYESFLGGVRYTYGPGLTIGIGAQTLDFDDAGTSQDGFAVFIEHSASF
jgi:predicted porin